MNNLELYEEKTFKKIINKAIIACKNSNLSVSDHFISVSKMIEIALSQTYFAIQTRKQV